MNKSYIKILLTILISISAFLGSIAYASVLSVQPSSLSVATGSSFTASVLLDSESKPINTIEGDLIYNKNNLVPEKIIIGKSFISFWVEKPNVINEGVIHFSGIVPGGVSVDKGELFNVVLKTNFQSTENLYISNANLFINDGQGTKDSATTPMVSVKVIDGFQGSVESSLPKDTTPPEPFKIQLVKDPSLYDGSYTIVFSTQDKGTGVDHYTVCELFDKNCTSAESPYLLKKQSPFYYIVVNAYDVDGNVTKSKIVSPWIYGIGFSILGLVFVGFILFKIKQINKNK